MMIHHIATIVLLTGCYTINMMQIGVLIALVHDVSDVPLEVCILYRIRTCYMCTCNYTGNTLTHAHTPTHTLTHAHTPTHTLTHAHTHAHTYTHTHTHTPASQAASLCLL